MDKKTYDCVIIGGGLSGLAAAARLSYYGKNILLIEKNANFGGLNTFYYKRGVEIDSGLHAMTNFCLRNSDKSSPLNKLLRQLRIPYDNFELIEQNSSEIRFPELKITFTNDFAKFAEDIKKLFPESAKGFDSLCEYIRNFDAFSLEDNQTKLTARTQIREFISNRYLEDVLLLPLMFYGSSSEYDMDLAQFVIMFRSIFMEGFCRPVSGIRTIIEILHKKLIDNGCEIRKSCSAESISKIGERFIVQLSDLSYVETEKVISCIGINETLKLVKDISVEPQPEGQMSFVEAIFCMREGFVLQGYNHSCVFYCDEDKFEFRKPDKAFSIESGVFCCPNNFRYPKGAEPKHIFLRLTALANHEYWFAADDEKYQQLKSDFCKAALEKISNLSGIVLKKEDIFFSDVFTPRTIFRWTGHINGAIYGSPLKVKSGESPIKNLFICGTDQGFLGIIGAILSGISIANKYALK